MLPDLRNSTCDFLDKKYLSVENLIPFYTEHSLSSRHKDSTLSAALDNSSLLLILNVQILGGNFDWYYYHEHVLISVNQNCFVFYLIQGFCLVLIWFMLIEFHWISWCASCVFMYASLFLPSFLLYVIRSWVVLLSGS